MKTNAAFLASSCALLAWVAFSPLAVGATLSGNVDLAPGPANLTLAGPIDWALWDYRTNTPVVTEAPFNKKLAGAGVISDITVATAGTTNTVRGASALGTELFSYSDGTVAPTVVNSPGQQFGLALDSDLDVAGQGVQFTITGNTAFTEVVQIWATGFSGQGNLQVSLNGAAPISLFSQTYGNSTKDPTLFTINFRPDAPGDVLTVKYILSTDTQGGTFTNSHVGIQAVAVSVPEPSAIAALLGGSTLLLGFRRRWQAV